MSAEMPSVAMRGIRKRFGPTVALDGVDFRAWPGRISAVIGENGAGKTTLMRILFGLARPDAGVVELYGATLPPGHSPRRAIELGIGMLQQHFSLVPAFSALENIVLGCEPRAGRRLDMAGAQRRVEAILDELGGTVDLSTPISALSVSGRQLVEIARMLFTGAGVLIFDEPTATLAPQEAARLYRLLERLAAEGRTIILITHRLAEVLAYADRVTVLRRGLVTACFEKGEMDEERLIGAIVPEAPIEAAELPQPEAAGRPAVELRGITCAGSGGREALGGVELRVREGEVLGIAGVTGSGQLELAETIAGLRPPLAGTITLGGRDVSALGTAARRRLGLVYIPEDRLADGIIAPFSLCLNRLLGDHRRRRFRSTGGYLMSAVREDVGDKIRRYFIDAEGPDAPLASLSGGNQQKLMLARELDREPRLIVAHGPTRGLDIVANRRCYAGLLVLAAAGAAVVIFSTEIGDLLRYSHRIAVLYGGRLLDAGSSGELSVREVGLLMTRGGSEGGIGGAAA